MTAPHVRRATQNDVEALVHLRGLMIEAMGTDPGGPDAQWRKNARGWYAEQLEQPGSFAAYVVDDPTAGVVANAVGHVNQHPPGPKDPTTLRGHLYNVSTEPAFRRRGLARLCVVALVDWFRDETAVGVVELNASPDGLALYEQLGFVTSRYPALRLYL
ncbi:GNAT family N-acetyltransferase [Kribbella sandramycini]|uniref:GNAT family N-acetyltransferase n=1 Tax=Kribbella sandramycini TaxID=60450 RepID=A0A7Y4P116_9ACTN|nr:GNAT family N-acetyltransferase [Kribbella sandramycini]MBB6565422.1 GNAT superfamily N-acetyltransferase [Kribbella sandramycini]NOL41690.1 GNAT family N-acetyltransferase [Kribbella sandramycini]